jgi:hypothetical protein
VSSQQIVGAEEVQVRRFVANAEALGVVVDFLSRDKPFSEFRVGVLVPAIRDQLTHQCQVCALKANVLIGYCGWVLITREMGEAWLKGQGQLKPVPPDRANAAALTIVRVTEPGLLRRLIRASRELNPGKRVYFRRDYATGQRAARHTSVLNV